MSVHMHEVMKTLLTVAFARCRDPAGSKRSKGVDLNEAVRRLQQDARAQEEATQ